MEYTNEPILTRIENGIQILILNRPKKKNALNKEVGENILYQLSNF